MGTTLSANDVRQEFGAPAGHAVVPESHIITVNDHLNIVPPQLTVIIPTRNEAGNVEPLLERLSAVLAGTAAEILFVDDSDDDTPDEVARVGHGLPLPVRLLRRS